MNTETLQPFFAALLDLSLQNHIEVLDFAKGKGKLCLSKFALHIAGNLEMEEAVAISALLIAKRAIDQGLRFTKKTLHRLIIVSFMLAEKMYEEEHHTLESYSLVSGIPMREITQLESKILLALDYHILISQEDVSRLKAGHIEQLFQCRSVLQERKGH